MTSIVLNPDRLHPYQRKLVSHLRQHPNAMLWVDMGLGKTISTLTAFLALQDRWEASAALVVGPLRVVQSVWRQEALKWSHTGRLRFSLIHGTEAQRRRALNQRADLYLINYENLEWLTVWIKHKYLGKDRYPPFDMIIYDEVTKMKNPLAIRSKAIQDLLPFFRRRVGLTGEPAANGYVDLHGQYLAIDGGARLGKNITAFKSAFLVPTEYGGRRYRVTEYGKQQIKERIHDITIEMSAEDYLDLPPVVENDIIVDLPPEARRAYEQMEHEFFLEVDSGGRIEAQTEATRGLKCLQLAGGAAYLTDSDQWQEIHRIKLDAVQDLLEEQAGEPVLLAYAFKHEAERIKKRFKDVQFLGSHLGEREHQRIVDAWNRREIPLLCGHPASMGHGLNLQEGGHTLCWYGLNWSLELYRQFNARLAGGHRRRGRIMLHHILARDTMDYAVKEALEGKATSQADLKQAINRYRATKFGKAA